MKRFCLALDLKPDATLIAEYEAHHRNVWPEILQSIQDSGILHLDIYRVENRLFMILEAEDDFSFERKNALDAAKPSGATMGAAHVAIPTGHPGIKTGGKMAVDGTHFQSPGLKGFQMGIGVQFDRNGYICGLFESNELLTLPRHKS